MEMVASRELELTESLGSTSKVKVILYKPVPVVGGGFQCQVSIEGLSGNGMPPIKGEDSMQALVLALSSLHSFITHSKECREGRIKWLGMNNLGFKTDL
jgi:hypothetical protein